MLSHIAMLEGAAEKLPGGREAAVVRTKLQEARCAEMERLRVSGTSPVDIGISIDTGLERGRAGAADKVFQMLGGQRAEL